MSNLEPICLLPQDWKGHTWVFKDIFWGRSLFYIIFFQYKSRKIFWVSSSTITYFICIIYTLWGPTHLSGGERKRLCGHGRWGSGFSYIKNSLAITLSRKWKLYLILLNRKSLPFSQFFINDIYPQESIIWFFLSSLILVFIYVFNKRAFRNFCIT